MQSFKIAILGASGYTGAELVRLIATHPGMEIVALTADRKAGQSMGAVFPHLRHLDLPKLTTIADVDFTGVDLAAAFSGVHALARGTLEDFASFDVVLTPSLAAPPAFPETLQLADGAEDFAAQCAFTPWTSTWNMLGTAALSVPLHREAVDGVELPFGVQLGATRPGDEPLVLALAAQLEAHDPWPLVRTPHAA